MLITIAVREADLVVGVVRVDAFQAENVEPGFLIAQRVLVDDPEAVGAVAAATLNKGHGQAEAREAGRLGGLQAEKRAVGRQNDLLALP